MFLIFKNKIATSIIFIIISNLIFNYNFLINLNYLETDFSLLVSKWFLGQYLFSYDVEFVKRGIISSIFFYLDINITYENIYIFCLIVFNALLLSLIFFILRINSRNIVQKLFLILLLSPFFVVSISNDIGRYDQLLYLILTLIILFIVNNKINIYIISILSSLGIFIHEIFFFIGFPLIFLFLLDKNKKDRNFKNILFFVIINLFSYLIIFLFGESTWENANLVYDKAQKIDETSFNTVLYFVTDIYQSNATYVKKTFINNINNFNFFFLITYTFLNYLIIYNLFRNYLLINKDIVSLIKYIFLFFLIFIFYYSFLNKYHDLFLLKFHNSPKKISLIILIIVYFLIIKYIGWKTIYKKIINSIDFCIFLSPLIIYLTFLLGSDYARYTSLILINLLLISIYFFQKFNLKKLNLLYLRVFLIFNFFVFVFYYLHIEKFERNALFLKFF